MEQRIMEFVLALRGAGLRISIAESQDSLKAVELLGVQDREGFREALRATLVKDAHGQAAFDELFPLFFSTGTPPMMKPQDAGLDDLSPEQMQMLQQAISQLRERIRELTERLMRGEQLSREELEQLARQAGLQYADNMQERRWIERRMMQMLGLDKLAQELSRLLQMLEQAGMSKDMRDAIRAQVQANADAMREQIQHYVGGDLARKQGEHFQNKRADDLMQRPFGSLTQSELQQLRTEVRRLAAHLRTRAALRQRRTRKGQIDVRRTMRHNLRYSGVPMELQHRKEVLKPRLVIICDISTSMRPVASFMLHLLYELQDQVSKTRSFAFISDMHEISEDLAQNHSSEAIDAVFQRMPAGYYNTDLGHSLDTFTHRFFDSTDRRTTVIVVGDGRNNYNDPRMDLIDQIRGRARRLVWFTPEPPMLWGSGDSDMHLYAQRADAVHMVSNLAELTAAIDRLFA